MGNAVDFVTWPMDVGVWLADADGTHRTPADRVEGPHDGAGRPGEIPGRPGRLTGPGSRSRRARSDPRTDRRPGGRCPVRPIHRSHRGSVGAARPVRRARLDADVARRRLADRLGAGAGEGVRRVGGPWITRRADRGEAVVVTARLSRRSFLGYSAVAGALASAGTLGAARTASRASSPAADTAAPFRWEEASIAELQDAMEAGELTALSLTRAYMERIRTLDWDGPKVNSVIELNPDAEAIAHGTRRGTVAGSGARPAPRHPDPAEGLHRHRGPDGDDRGLARAARCEGAPRRRCRGLAAGGGGGPAGQGEHVRVERLPRLAAARRLERPRGDRA